MNRTENDLLVHIEGIAWDPNVSDLEKIHDIQSLLYQWSAMQDNKTDEMFGDDDAHVNSPNMKRI